ncbi:conserved protein of unknown function [Pseudodesulfovibrio piezophilus C1TLV30]|uniref:Thioredoxin domain-containing protein n=1 Tax=Pseudodesulfovibrio piezophilus (strain DSM 21447 / JCM 15486 / C1TLV30) TaxID=1322246 RepID=M1WR98_PSEP2|nr:conserved protein of unknown function [Pseudodesulfovibrio piezophilus C1TLV30]
MCYVFDAYYIDSAMERFMIDGTPIFLLFSNGREKDRLMGDSDREIPEECIRDSVATK